MDDRRFPVVPALVVAALGLAAILLVAGTLRRPEPPTFAPTSIPPREVGERWTGPRLYTVDATDDGAWRFFDFSRGTVVDRPGPLEWDLAFRRHEILVNGGAGFPGRGGARAIEGVSFDRVGSVPADGYEVTASGRDSTNPALERWYDYGFTTHLLTPRPIVYAVRTADGRYAKLRIVSYYCPGARAGCVTFRYAYQGDGSRRMAPRRKGG